MYIRDHVCSYRQYGDVIGPYIWRTWNGVMWSYSGSIPKLPTRHDSQPCCSAVPTLRAGNRRVYVLHLSYFLLRRSLDLEGDGTVPGTAITPPFYCLHFDYHPRAADVESGSRRRGRVQGGSHAPSACLQNWPTRCATAERPSRTFPAFLCTNRISMHEPQYEHESAESRPAEGSNSDHLPDSNNFGSARSTLTAT